MGLRIVEGRDFIDGDDAPGAVGAVILDEKTAKVLFPHESAVGRRVEHAGAVDEAAFRRLVGWQIAEGSAALVPCGTTGEAPTIAIDFTLLRMPRI